MFNITKMVEYSCQACGKVFKQKCHYEKHLQRKTPCDNTVSYTHLMLPTTPYV